MSKHELYRNPADQNPLDLSQVPNMQLEHKFPIATQYPFKSTCRRFVWDLYLIAVGSAAISAGMNFGSVFIAVGATFIIMQLARREARGLAPTFSVGVVLTWAFGFGCFLAYRSGFSEGLIALASAALALTLIVAYLFRAHWIAVACCGMLDKESIDNFKATGRLPPGIKPKPLFKSYKAALHSWITYDPRRCKSPGTQASPAGSAVTRVTMTSAVVVLWAGFAVTLVSGLSGLAVLPFLLLLAAFLPLVAMAVAACSILGKAYALMEVQFEPASWRPFVRRLSLAQSEHVKKSLYLGRVFGDGSPIHYPTERLMHGGWIQGPPGSGKTVMLMQLVEQLIWQGYSVVTLDLKASSNELYWTARSVAKEVLLRQRRRVPTYAFTPTHGKASHLFDLYSQSFWKSLSPEEQASCMIGIFGLNHPCVYPQDYFRDSAWSVQQHVTSKYPNINSFQEAAEYFARELQFAQEPWELSQQNKKHGEHPRLILRRLGLADAMNARPTYSQEILDSAIQLESLFHTPSVLHCSLPAVSDPVANPEIGRVILNALLHAGAYSKKSSVKVVVLIDEFQRMISRSIDVVLQQARSSGVGVILTNQTSADLVAVDANMPGTLSGVTALQAWIKATDFLGVQQVQTFGGQYIDHMISTSVRDTSNGRETTYTRSEHLLDRCSSGLIDRVNVTPNQYFLRLNDAEGYAAYGGQMMVVQSGYHLTKKEYDDLVSRPWLKPRKGMLINGQHRPPLTPPSSALTGPKPPKIPRTPTRLTN
ncbi:ATP-binding protein [Botrimarina sp.]|uniref:ATP-binding protein n=1 Tax=Botrimarina sp. TaxID=2795802 RepID=UPI0032EEA5B3